MSAASCSDHSVGMVTPPSEANGSSKVDKLQGLWVHVALFSSPRGVCNMEQLCKSIRALLLSASTGTKALQRYWCDRHVELTWSEQDAKRFLVRLQKGQGKIQWKLRFRETFEAECRSTRRGVGCNNSERIQRTPTEALNRPLPHVVPQWGANNDTSMLQRTDSSFVNCCLDGGLTSDYFLKPSESITLSRTDYISMKNSKRKGKHQKGSQNLWDSWEQCE